MSKLQGVILYNRLSYIEAGNIKSLEQLLRLTDSIRRHPKIPPFAESGKEWKYSPSFVPWVSSMAIIMMPLKVIFEVGKIF